MPKTDQDRVVALAGVMQATDLVRSIARRGQIQADDFETCMASLIQIDAPSSVDIYGGINRLLTGLRLLEQQLHNPQDMELTRYVVTLLRLEYKLSRREEMLDTLSAGIKDIIQNLAHFPLTHSNTIARFADLYLQTISTLSPRIMVSGVQAHLNNPGKRQPHPGAVIGRSSRRHPLAAMRWQPLESAAAAQCPAARNPVVAGSGGLIQAWVKPG